MLCLKIIIQLKVLKFKVAMLTILKFCFHCTLLLNVKSKMSHSAEIFHIERALSHYFFISYYTIPYHIISYHIIP